MSDKFHFTVDQCNTIQNISVTHVVFMAGKGEVRVNFSDGSVTLTNCELPEAAQAFWEQVTLAFPAFREVVKNSP